MRLVDILGSPRAGGNSAQTSAMLVAGLQPTEVTHFELNKLDARGCQGCMACKGEREECRLVDGLTPVLRAIAEADVVVLSSPVYFGEVSAQTKTLVDRLYSALPEDYLERSGRGRIRTGKTLVLILSQGHPSPDAYADVAFRYHRIFRRIGFDDVLIIRGLGLWARRQASDSEAVRSQVRETVAFLATSGRRRDEH